MKVLVWFRINLLLIFAIVSMASNSLGVEKSQEININSFVNSKVLFYTARLLFYKAEIEPRDVESMLLNCKDTFLKNDDNFDKYYWLAQVEFQLAEVKEVKNEKREAVKAFTQSSEYVKKALQLNSNSSDANRLLADCYMRLMNYKGSFYAMMHSSEAFKLINKAIELDQQNYTAYNSLATYYIYSPKIAGGDLNKAINTLEKALTSKDEFTNFISYLWLGLTYHKLNEQGKTIKNLNNALKIYPDNYLAKGLLKEYQSNL